MSHPANPEAKSASSALDAASRTRLVALGVDADTLGVLARHGFDAPAFFQHQAGLAAGRPSSNQLGGTLLAPSPADIPALPELGSAGRRALHARGLQALRAGEVGVVILAGGMATRFGGIVKAGAAALDGLSFLDLKLQDVANAARAAERPVPVYLMASFSTAAEVERLATARPLPTAPTTTFTQFVSLRLTPSGALHRDSAGNPSPYAPGHGDMSFALRRTGILQGFVAGGGRLLFMSNVDNVTATLDPAILGFHLEQGGALTAEVVSKDPGDRGGAPAWVDGRLQIVEAFRFPAAFDQDSIPVFNTNTLVFDAAALDQDFPLTWFEVAKQVDGKPVIQLERLVGELSAHLESRFLHVQRTGPDARFQPAKDPEELARRQDEIRTALTARGILP